MKDPLLDVYVRVFDLGGGVIRTRPEALDGGRKGQTGVRVEKCCR